MTVGRRDIVTTCPRQDCPNYLTDGKQIVCIGDFVLLASTCRGKKPLERWVADAIAAPPGKVAYQCPLCRFHHNGNRIGNPEQHFATVTAIVAALRADPRVGPQGLLGLVDSWAPGNVNRSCWHEGLDQTVAMHLPL